MAVLLTFGIQMNNKIYNIEAADWSSSLVSCFFAKPFRIFCFLLVVKPCELQSFCQCLVSAASWPKEKEQDLVVGGAVLHGYTHTCSSSYIRDAVRAEQRDTGVTRSVRFQPVDQTQSSLCDGRGCNTAHQRLKQKQKHKEEKAQPHMSPQIPPHTSSGLQVRIQFIAHTCSPYFVTMV